MNVPITLANGNTVELNNITESGKGYIRFSDGTQICYGRSGNVYTSELVKFAKNFIDTPEITATQLFDNNDFSTIDPNYVTLNNFAGIVSIVNNGFNPMVMEGSSTAFCNVSYIAIGRWK